jgi:hypothetical protein
MAFYIVADTSRLSCEGANGQAKAHASQLELARAHAACVGYTQVQAAVSLLPQAPEPEPALRRLAPVAIGYASLRQVVG